MQKRCTLLCSILVLLGCVLVACANSSGISRSEPAPNVWYFYQDSMFIQNAGNAFSLKYIGIWPQEFTFFYAYKLSLQPDIIVFSSFAKGETNLKMRMQPLGIIDNVHVGVLHAIRIDRIGQTIGLRIILPRRPHFLTWNLPLLKQQMEEPHRDTTMEAFTDSGRKEPVIPVEFDGPVMKEQVSYFRPTTPAQLPSHKTYIFIRMDSPAVTTITKDQYLAIAGSANFQE